MQAYMHGADSVKKKLVILISLLLSEFQVSEHIACMESYLCE